MKPVVRWLPAVLFLVVVGPAAYVERAGPENGFEWRTNTRPEQPLQVYVVVWDYHTSILIEQVPNGRLGPPGNEKAPFVEYAWGDRRFYMESNYLAVPLTLFWPTESVTYVRGWNSAPEPGLNGPTVYVRSITPDKWKQLVQSLENAFKRSMDGKRATPFSTVPGYSGRFYPGRGWYVWSYTCNRWTVERLREAGLAGNGLGVIFSGQVPARLIGFEHWPEP